MNTLSLALRNLLRNRRRSLATLLAMAVGLVAVLLFGGYRSNVMHGTQTAFVQQWGHLEIQRRGYFADGGENPTDFGIADYQTIIDAVKRDPELAPMLTVVTPTLRLGGLAGNSAAGISRSVAATGIVADEWNKLIAWNDFDTISYASPLPLAGSSEDKVVVGTGVARKLKLCRQLDVPDCDASPAASKEAGPALPDDIAALSSLEGTPHDDANVNQIELLAATARGAPNVTTLTVIKADNMGIKAIDDVYMAMHLQKAQRLIYGSGTPQVTAILVQLQHTRQLPAAHARLQKLLAEKFADRDLELFDFAALNPMYEQTNQFMDSLFGFIAILIGVIVVFTISNTMSTAIMERTVEIGTLRAMGLRRSGIRRLFICEALLLALIGAAIGVACALGIAYAINNSGWSWVPPGYSYAYLILVRVWQDPALMIGSVAGTVVITVLSAWWPANRAAKMIIVDALRHN